MTIALRIRKIREISGWKQAAVASSLNISQQAYSSLEKGADNAKIETLQKFCEAMNVNLSFLFAMDIDITEDSLREFGSKGFAEVVSGYRRMSQKVEVFQDMFNSQMLGKDSNMLFAAGRTA